MSNNKIDPSSANNAANNAFIANLVEQGGFAENAGSAEDPQATKGHGRAGKNKAASDGGKITASMSKAPKGEAVDTVAGGGVGGKAATAPSDGGSLRTDAQSPALSPSTTSEVKGLANDVTPEANEAAEAVPQAPLNLDKDPKVAAAQTQLAHDMNDPKASQQQISDDVKNLIKVLKDAGRSDEAVQVLTDAMPANTTERNMASIFAEAAKLGVDLDSNASKMKDAKATASLNKVDRAQQAQAQKAAQQAAQGQAQPYDQSKQRGATGGGASGPSNWDGKKATVSNATNDTSSAGGDQLSYSGPASNFPNDPSKWASWDDLWSKASSQMQGPNTAEQTQWIKAAIEDEAAKTGIDKRFILAVVMQESSGNVNVGTTNNGVNNPGLMQSHNGASFDGTQASVQQMIKDGVEGTASGDGLIQGLQQTGNLFAAGRMYNSGQMNADNLSDPMGATASYCSDLANRLMGRM